MKKYILAFTVILAALYLGGCGRESQSNKEDLNRLTKIEVYSADDNILINTVEDKEVLIQFNKWVSSDFSYSEEDQDKWKQEAENSRAAYSIVSFKSPAAMINDKTPEKEMTITVFENSNIIKQQIDPGNIKNFSLPSEFLVFYYEISDEDMEFLQFLAGEE